MNKQQSMKLTYLVYGVSVVLGLFVYFLVHQVYSVLISTLIADIAMTAIVFAFSNRFNNSSIYDPYWSVIPIFIVLLWLLVFDSFTFYTSIVFIGVLIWGLRLTLNWYQNFTGYSHEDFRYVEFREQSGKLYWVVSFVGIHLFPTLIVFLALYPIYYILTSTVQTPIWMVLGTLVMIGGAYISFVSDNQLRAHKKTSTTESIHHGLWKYSRHPNYFGEVTFWFGVYITSLSVGLSFLSALGFLGMLLLFNLYSVPKMEQKLLKNKEDYQMIVDNVPRFFIRKPKAD